MVTMSITLIADKYGKKITAVQGISLRHDKIDKRPKTLLLVKTKCRL